MVAAWKAIFWRVLSFVPWPSGSASTQGSRIQALGISSSDHRIPQTSCEFMFKYIVPADCIITKELRLWWINRKCFQLPSDAENNNTRESQIITFSLNFLILFSILDIITIRMPLFHAVSQIEIHFCILASLTCYCLIVRAAIFPRINSID